MATQLVSGILKGVLAMALADGELQSEEREVLALLVDRFGLEEGELAEAIGDAKRFHAEDLREDLDHDDRMLVAQYAVMAAAADGHLEDSEKQFLEQLELKLGLDTKDVRALEALSRELMKVASKRPIDVDALNDALDAFMG